MFGPVRNPIPVTRICHHLRRHGRRCSTPEALVSSALIPRTLATLLSLGPATKPSGPPAVEHTVPLPWERDHDRPLEAPGSQEDHHGQGDGQGQRGHEPDAEGKGGGRRAARSL